VAQQVAGRGWFFFGFFFRRGSPLSARMGFATRATWAELIALDEGEGVGNRALPRTDPNYTLSVPLFPYVSVRCSAAEAKSPVGWDYPDGPIAAE